jgi:membrane protease subunit HflC
VQLSGVNLGATGLEDIYGRMRSAAGAKAAELHAAGAAQAGRIRAQADAERERLLWAADAQAKKIRTQGEARAAVISAEAARQDPEFFSYFQNLEAYRRSLAGRTTLVLDQDSPFLKYLKPPPH